MAIGLLGIGAYVIATGQLGNGALIVAGGGVFWAFGWVVNRYLFRQQGDAGTAAVSPPAEVLQAGSSPGTGSPGSEDGSGADESSGSDEDIPLRPPPTERS